MVADIFLISFCISFIILFLSTFSLSYLSDVLDINVTALLNSDLTALVYSVLLKISTIYFFTFFIKLPKMATQSGEDNPSEKISSTFYESFKLPSSCFFGSSPFAELSLSSVFLPLPAKYFFKYILRVNLI